MSSIKIYELLIINKYLNSKMWGLNKFKFDLSVAENTAFKSNESWINQEDHIDKQLEDGRWLNH